MKPMLEKMTRFFQIANQYLIHILPTKLNNRSIPTSSDSLETYTQYIHSIENNYMRFFAHATQLDMYQYIKKLNQRQHVHLLLKITNQSFRPIGVSILTIYQILKNIKNVPLEYQLELENSYKECIDSLFNSNQIRMPVIDTKEMIYYERTFAFTATATVINNYLQNNLQLFDHKIEIYKLTLQCKNGTRYCLLQKDNIRIAQFGYPNTSFNYYVSDTEINKIKNKLYSNVKLTFVFEIHIAQFRNSTCNEFLDTNIGHANVAMYNTTTKILEIFEPHGFELYNGLEFCLEHFIKNLLKFEISNTISGFKVCHFLDGGPQAYDILRCLENGFCLMWSYFYLFIRLLNSQMDPDTCLTKAMQHIIDLTLAEQQTNPNYCYILRFARKLIMDANQKYFVSSILHEINKIIDSNKTINLNMATQKKLTGLKTDWNDVVAMCDDLLENLSAYNVDKIKAYKELALKQLRSISNL